MIAVVDHQADRGIEIRAATAARLPSLLVHDDVTPALGEAHCRGKPGNSGADDVNRPWLHQKRRALSTARMTRPLGVRTRARGALQPRAFSFSRMR